MKSRTLTGVTVVTLFAALAIPFQVAAQQQKKELAHYTVIDLGTLGGTFRTALSVNNKGQVAGFAALPNDTAQHAFLWRRGVIKDLGTLGGPNSSASFPLNERGEVPGFSETGAQDPLAENFCSFGTSLECVPFIWQKGVMTQLPTLGGSNGQADEVNNRGQVVGLAENNTLDTTCPGSDLQVKPVIWENGKPQEFPTFSGDPDGFATAINDQGQAVGASGSCFLGPAAAAHALLWQNGTVTNLGNLGGTAGPNSPQDINNQGQVVGFSVLADNTTIHAFLWENGVMSDLGALPGPLGIASLGFGVNEKGQVVGTSIDIQGDPHAFIWQQGVMTELNDLTPAGSPLFLLFAFSINSRGEIVGEAFEVSTGEAHAYLAVPSNGEVNGKSTTSAAPGNNSERPNVVLPENVREMLRQQLGKRYHIRGLGATPRD